MLSALGRLAAPAEASAFRTPPFRVLDTTLTIIFYACSGLAIAGSLGATLAEARWRGPALIAVAVGAAGALASLSAGFAALLALVALGGCALLIGALPGLPGDHARRAGDVRSGRVGLAAGLGAVMAAVLLGAMLYAVLGTSFGVHTTYPGGWFGAAALGRAFFGRDALAMLAVAGMLLVGLAVGVAARARR